MGCKRLLPDLETPPRAWGRVADYPATISDSGNTPTGVGKSHMFVPPSVCLWKHPHGRGEEQPLNGFSLVAIETPPRAWGRVRIKVTYKAIAGNTPTGVGKSSMTALYGPGVKKHPHGRGEEDVRYSMIVSPGETPPRAWGRDPEDRTHKKQTGNTPTGVGKRVQK